MKTLIATLLAGVAGASFAAAPTAALNHDPATYRNATAKATADYKSALAKCASMSGTDKDVCQAEAKAARARTEADAVAKYNDTDAGRARARAKLADADYDVAKARCGAHSGADKDNCLNEAKSTHTAALADARAGRETGSATEHMKAAAAITAEKTKDMAQNAAERTRQATATAAQKTENAMERAGEKTRDTAAAVADRTERASDNAAANARQAGAKTSVAAADTAITTKVKAGLMKEPDLSSLGIHVETEQGVVMLSGFVASKAEADKAVQVARQVEGVSNVKSAIKVK